MLLSYLQLTVRIIGFFSSFTTGVTSADGVAGVPKDMPLVPGIVRCLLDLFFPARPRLLSLSDLVIFVSDLLLLLVLLVA